jgi:hypothetical protein
MIEAQNAPDIPSWLYEFFEQNPKPQLVTSSFLSEWGPSLLDEKLKKRKLCRGNLPTKLSFDEIAATLMHLFSFKRMVMPSEPDALGIRIDGQEDIWKTTSKRIGEYQTNTQFIYHATLLITPTHRKLDTTNVMRHIRTHAPEMILPIPPCEEQSGNTISNFWNSFEEMYDWDMIPLELLYRTYQQWFIIYATEAEDHTPIKPLLFKKQVRLLSSERWVMSGRRMDKI